MAKGKMTTAEYIEHIESRLPSMRGEKRYFYENLLKKLKEELKNKN